MRPAISCRARTDLVEKLGVSRTSVREAVRVLSAKGLLQARRRVGVRVRERDDWNLFDLHTLVNSGARATVRATMHGIDGALHLSMAQELLIRRLETPLVFEAPPWLERASGSGDGVDDGDGADDGDDGDDGAARG